MYVAITLMVDILEYRDHGGRSPFREWFDKLSSEASRKITTALYRMGLGNFSNPKSVGLAFMSAGSISALGTACILGRTKNGFSSFLAAERNDASRTTLALHSNDGKTTNRGRSNRKKRNENGFDERFQGNGSGARET